jgi:glycosyltransferase involved in cell wall biosynthesis
MRIIHLSAGTGSYFCGPCMRDNALMLGLLHAEAFGLYLLEAMASGVPVVQPRRGAFPEIVEATGGGWIYNPGVRERSPHYPNCGNRRKLIARITESPVIRAFVACLGLPPDPPELKPALWPP